MTALLAAAEQHAKLKVRPKSVVLAVLRAEVDFARNKVLNNELDESLLGIEFILGCASDRIEELESPRLRRVINATGIVLHTGLGRSVLPTMALDRLMAVASGYSNLELDLETGKRGLRGTYVESLLRELTGAEAALVVNNNAAATVLVLAALARDRDVLVSRGQLIEIGGSYRLPDVMQAGGARLCEVGTTNKTRIADYEKAVTDATALVMHVHTSNYRVVGFAEMPGTAELVTIARQHGLLMYDDLGSGALNDDGLWAKANEPTVAASLRAGADVVSFSGDKLLGGPQAGILVGRREVIDRLRAHPMARALRVGKLTLAALEATLECYQNPEVARQSIPLLAMLNEPRETLAARAQRLAEKLGTQLHAASVDIFDDESFAGGGSLPAWPLATVCVRLRLADGASVDEFARRLRVGEPSVLCRINDDAIVFDMRTVRDAEVAVVVAAVEAAVGVE